VIRITPSAREDLRTVLSSELGAGRAARILIDDYT